MLLLTLKTFSLTGGIEKVNRTLAKVLYDYHHTVGEPRPTKFEMLSLCDHSKDLNPKYCNADDFTGYKGNKLAYGINGFLKGLQHDIILLSHINLLFIALLIKFVKPKKRIILIAHGIEVWRDLSNWKRKFLQKNVDIWAVSNFTASVLTEKHKIAPQAIHILNNCLDPYFNLPSKFEKPEFLLKRHQISATQPVLLTVSRLSSAELYKGYDLVIETLKNLIPTYPNLLYLLAGKYDAQEKLRVSEMIKKDNLTAHVLLLDFIPDHELTDYFLLADLFIMPSKKEGFGIVFIEAAACGCSVIAGNKDGSTDALLNGELGLLINPDDKEEIESAVYNFFKIEKSVVESEKIQQKCLAHFSYEGYRDRVLKLLVN